MNWTQLIHYIPLVLYMGLFPLCVYGLSKVKSDRELESGRRDNSQPTMYSKTQRKMSYAFTRFPLKWWIIGGWVVGGIACVVCGYRLDLLHASIVGASASIAVPAAILIVTAPGYSRELSTITRLLDLKKAYMKLTDSKANIWNHKGEFDVTKWSKKGKVLGLTLTIPAAYDAKNKGRFLAALSETLGDGGFYRPDDDEGWGQSQASLQYDEFTCDKTFLSDFIEFKKKNMGLVNSSSTVYSFTDELEVTDTDDNNKPTKMAVKLPVGFDPAESTAFLDKMTTLFGRGRPWEIDPEAGGWDADEKKAHLSLESPLPQLADWDEKYVNHPDVQWSFFPLGIGSKWGVPIKDDDGNEIHLVGFDVNGAQGKYMDKNGITKHADIMPSPHAIVAGVTGGGKSVMMRNVILKCLMRPKEWQLCIIDLKIVESSLWRKYGVPIATNYADCAVLLQWVQSTMMERFSLMSKMGVTDYKDVPDHGPGVLVDVDEVSELLAPVKGSSDEIKETKNYQSQCRQALESIARLGRAAMVHLLIAGQRPDAEVVPMQVRQNCPTRLAAGALPQTIAQMVFESDSSFATSLPSSPKGRCAMKIHSARPNKYQGFFASEDWLDRYLEEHHLPTQIYGSSPMLNDYENSKKKAEQESNDISKPMTQEESLNAWDDEMADLVSDNFD